MEHNIVLFEATMGDDPCTIIMGESAEGAKSAQSEHDLESWIIAVVPKGPEHDQRVSEVLEQERRYTNRMRVSGTAER